MMPVLWKQKINRKPKWSLKFPCFSIEEHALNIQTRSPLSPGIHLVSPTEERSGMRYSRQEKIVQLIKNNEIETQGALVAMLAEAGYHATQATISRDIKELRLVKAQSQQTGKYIYTLPAGELRIEPAVRYENIFRNTVNSIESAGNILVIKTVSGCANAAGEALDLMEIDGIVGTLAGDNTLFAVADLPEHALLISQELRRILEKE